jgi:hypothetical protein
VRLQEVRSIEYPAIVLHQEAEVGVDEGMQAVHHEHAVLQIRERLDSLPRDRIWKVRRASWGEEQPPATGKMPKAGHHRRDDARAIAVAVHGNDRQSFVHDDGLPNLYYRAMRASRGKVPAPANVMPTHAA